MLFKKVAERSQQLSCMAKIFVMQRVTHIVDHHPADFTSATSAVKQIAGKGGSPNLRQMFMFGNCGYLRRVESAHSKAVFECDHDRSSRSAAKNHNQVWRLATRQALIPINRSPAQYCY
jgi:hypothetical protein